MSECLFTFPLPSFLFFPPPEQASRLRSSLGGGEGERRKKLPLPPSLSLSVRKESFLPLFRFLKNT